MSFKGAEKKQDNSSSCRPTVYSLWQFYDSKRVIKISIFKHLVDK